jgi:hypothetical protein
LPRSPLGALIGAALPSSETESHSMGGATDDGGGPFGEDSSVAEASVVPAPPGEHVEL